MQSAGFSTISMQAGRPPSEALIRQRLQIGVSNDPAELGARYPLSQNQGISMHFVSNEPLLGVGYATKDNAWSTSDYKVDARNTISAHCSSRYRINMKRLPDGRYEYDIRFDPIVAGARIDVGSRSYFIPSTQPLTRNARPSRGARLPRSGTTLASVDPSRAEAGQHADATASPHTDAPVELPPSKLKALGESIAPIANADTKVYTPPVVEFPEDSYVPKSVNLGSIFGGDVVGDYHIPGAGERESAIVKGTLDLADTALSEEVKKTLHDLFSQERLVEGSLELRQLFRQTVAAINEQKAQESGLSEASEEMKSLLGLPKNTRAFLSLSGGSVMGLSEKDVREAFNWAYGDMIRIRGFQPKLVKDDDVVIFQAYTDNKGGPICLGMSTITGGMADRKTWQVSQYDATYEHQPFLHVHNKVDRNPNPRVESFEDWEKARSAWLHPPGSGSGTSALETALKEKEEMITAEAEREKARLEREHKRAAEVAKQSAIFARVSNGQFRVGYGDSTIDEIINKSVSSVPAERTGTYQVDPSAGISLRVSAANTEARTITIDSFAQLNALPEADKKLSIFALTTPHEGDAELSLRNVVDLFPKDVYRPGWVASWFNSPRYYGGELLAALKPQYEALESPAEQRKFLLTLYGELSSAGSVTAENVESLQTKLAPTK